MKTPLSHYVCSLCRLELSFNDVRYSPDGKRLVCNSCYSKMQKSKQEHEASTSFRSVMRKEPHLESIDVMCTRCNYRFLYRKDLKPICPYCGNSSLKKYEEMNAQSILNDVENMK